MSEIKPFRDWFKEKHGFEYPNNGPEQMHVVVARIADDFAEWTTVLVDSLLSKAPTKDKAE